MALSAVPATLSSHFICYAAEDITWTSNVIIRSRACLLACDTSSTAGAAMCRNIIVKWNIVKCQLVLIQEAVPLHTTHTPPRPTTHYTHTPRPTTHTTSHYTHTPHPTTHTTSHYTHDIPLHTHTTYHNAHTTSHYTHDIPLHTHHVPQCTHHIPPQLAHLTCPVNSYGVKKSMHFLSHCSTLIWCVVRGAWCVVRGVCKRQCETVCFLQIVH